MCDYRPKFALHQQQKQYPHLFSNNSTIPLAFLYALQGNAKKFCSHLSEYHFRFGIEQLRYLVVEAGRVGLLNVCVCCNRSKMVIEIAKYFPDMKIPFDCGYHYTIYDTVDYLRYFFNIKIAPQEESLLFALKLLDNQINVDFTHDYYIWILSEMVEEKNRNLLKRYGYLLFKYQSRRFPDFEPIFDFNYETELTQCTIELSKLEYQTVSDSINLIEDTNLLSLVLNIIKQQTEIIFPCSSSK